MGDPRRRIRVRENQSIIYSTVPTTMNEPSIYKQLINIKRSTNLELSQNIKSNLIESK